VAAAPVEAAASPGLEASAVEALAVFEAEPFAAVPLVPPAVVPLVPLAVPLVPLALAAPLAAALVAPEGGDVEAPVGTLFDVGVADACVPGAAAVVTVKVGRPTGSSRKTVTPVWGLRRPTSLSFSVTVTDVPPTFTEKLTCCPDRPTAGAEAPGGVPVDTVTVGVAGVVLAAVPAVDAGPAGADPGAVVRPESAV
jgi:hypothetical protein